MFSAFWKEESISTFDASSITELLCYQYVLQIVQFAYYCLFPHHGVVLG